MDWNLYHAIMNQFGGEKGVALKLLETYQNMPPASVERFHLLAMIVGMASDPGPEEPSNATA